VHVSGRVSAAQVGDSCIAAQTKVAMERVACALTSTGSNLSSVLRCIVILRDVARSEEFEKVFASYFDGNRVPPYSLLESMDGEDEVHIECIARLPVRG
jgi:enamine deaminase RidA (YjgF/YER057c/UK114 family)